MLTFLSWFLSLVTLCFFVGIVRGNLQGLQIFKRHTVNIKKPCKAEHYSYFKGNLFETCLLIEEDEEEATQQYNILIRRSVDLGKSWEQEKECIEGGTNYNIKSFFTFTSESHFNILYFQSSDIGKDELFRISSRDGESFVTKKIFYPRSFLTHWSVTPYSIKAYKIFGKEEILLCGLHKQNSGDEPSVYHPNKDVFPFILCVGSDFNSIQWRTHLYFYYSFDDTMGHVYAISPKVFENELGFKIEYSTKTSQHNAQYVKCVSTEKHFFDCYHVDLSYQRVLKDFTKVNGFYLAIESPEDTENQKECYLHFVYHRLFAFPDQDNISTIPKKNNECNFPQLISMNEMAFLSYRTESAESRVLTLFSLDGMVTHCTILTEPLLPSTDLIENEISDFFDEQEVAITNNVSVFKDKMQHASRFQMIANKNINNPDDLENFLNPGFEKKNGKYLCEVQWSDLVASGENNILNIVMLNYKKNTESILGGSSLLHIHTFEDSKSKDEPVNDDNKTNSSKESAPYTFLRNIKKMVHDSFNKATGNNDTNDTNENIDKKNDAKEKQNNFFFKVSEIEIESTESELNCSLPLSFSTEFPSINLVHSIEKTVIDEFYTEYKLRINKKAEEMLFYPASVHCILGKNFFLKLNFDVINHITFFNTSYPFLQVHPQNVLNLKFPMNDVTETYKHFTPSTLQFPENTTFIKLDTDQYVYKLPSHFDKDRKTFIAFPNGTGLWNLKNVSIHKRVNFDKTILVDIRNEEQKRISEGEPMTNQENKIPIDIPLRRYGSNQSLKIELICAYIKDNQNTCFNKINSLQGSTSKEIEVTKFFNNLKSDILIYPKYFVHSTTPNEIYEQSSISFGASFILNFSNYEDTINTFSCKCSNSKGNVYEIVFTFLIN